MIENRIRNIFVVGSAVMTRRNEFLEKSITEVIIIKDSADHCEENMQHKQGEKWYLIEIEARETF